MDPLFRSGDSEAGPLSLFEEHILPRGCGLVQVSQIRRRFASGPAGENPTGESIVKRCATWESAAETSLSLFGQEARQDDNPRDVEAVAQVFAKPTRGDLSGQVPVCGRDDMSVCAECFRTPDALELLLLKDAQNLGLGRERQLADFVEKEGATGGTLEVARASGGRLR